MVLASLKKKRRIFWSYTVVNNKPKQRSLRLKNKIKASFYDYFVKSNYTSFLRLSTKLLESKHYPGFNDNHIMFKRRLEKESTKDINYELRDELSYKLLNSKYSPYYKKLDHKTMISNNESKFLALKNKINKCL